MDEWELNEREQTDRYRTEYRRLGLHIFESFEEYCQDQIDNAEH